MGEVDAVPQRFRPAVEEVVRRLAAGDYEGVAADHCPDFWRPGFDLGMWARQYEHEGFVPLPPEAWRVGMAREIGRNSGVWAVSVPIWAKTGQTDLTLELDVRETHDGFELQVNNLHVM